MQSSKLKAALFDLDGTLLDTAPDLAFALNSLLKDNHRPILPFEVIRPHVGRGGKSLVKLGFEIDENHPEFYALWQNLLTLYSEHICDQTKIFPGIEQVLNYLAKKDLPWGIVTNKPGWLTELLLKKIGLFNQTNCIVSGDTLAKRKPDPEPLWYACKLLQCAAFESIYIGDAECDIQAAKRAGMATVAALYGYIGESDDPETWGADKMAHSADEILTYISNYP